MSLDTLLGLVEQPRLETKRLSARWADGGWRDGIRLDDVRESSFGRKLEQPNCLLEGDCLEALKRIPDRSVSMVLCDLPYGTTQNRWDSVIPLEALWEHYRRILADSGIVVLTSQGLFTARLILSNERWYKYKLSWIKSKPTNFLNARKQPLRQHEDICVFYPKQPHYEPQMRAGEAYDKGRRKAQFTGSYGKFRPSVVKSDGERFPTDVVYFKTAESEGPVWHPTQKPVELGRYLIRTYTKPGDTVLDNAFGSGSFLVAALLEKRNFIGVERNCNTDLFKEGSIDLIRLAQLRLLQAATLNPEVLKDGIVRTSPLISAISRSINGSCGA